MTRRLLCFLLACLAISRASAAIAWADDAPLQPVLIASLASIREFQRDLDHLGQGIQHPGLGDAVGQLLTAATSVSNLDGMDRDRRYGACIASNGLDIVGMICVPISDFEKLLAALPSAFSSEQQAQKGLYKIGQASFTGYLKDGGEWACMAQTPEVFEMLASPGKMLAELPDTHDAFARLYVQRMPEALRTMAVDRIRESSPAAPSEDVANSNFDLERWAAEFAAGYLARVLLEADRVDLSWTLDAASDTSAVECKLVPLNGTTLASAVARLGDVDKNFASQPSQKSETSAVIDWPIGAEAPGLPLAAVEQALDALRRSIDLSDAKNQPALALLDDMFEAAKKQATDQGRIQAGLRVLGRKPPHSLIVGIRLGEEAATDLVQQARRLGLSPTPNASAKDGASRASSLVQVFELGRMSDEDPALAKVFGEQPPLHLAISGEMAWLTIGSEGIPALRQGLKTQADVNESSFRITAATGALLPLLVRLSETDQQRSAALLSLVSLQLRSVDDRATLEIVSEQDALITRVTAHPGVLRAATLGLSITIEQYLKNRPSPTAD